VISRTPYGFQVNILSIFRFVKKFSSWMKEKKRHRLENKWGIDVVRCKVCLSEISDSNLHVYSDKDTYCENCFHAIYGKEDWS